MPRSCSTPAFNDSAHMRGSCARDPKAPAPRLVGGCCTTPPFPPRAGRAAIRAGPMPQRNALTRLAALVPSPLDGLAAMAAANVTDAVGGLDGLRGDEPDDWDPDYIRRTLPWMKRTFGAYFRGEVEGLDNIPDGPSLLVGNHSGGTMIADTFVFAQCFYEHFGPDRRFHQLAHDVAARMPALGIIRRYGTLAASHENAKRAFADDAPVLVYPGGDYETFRPSWHGDQIEFGGRKGFIRLALEEGV